MKVYQRLAMHVQSRLMYQTAGDDEGVARLTEKIDQLVKDHLPQDDGFSGFDGITVLDLDKSNPDKLVFHADFYNESGDGFTHTVTVTPALVEGFHLSVTGKGTKGTTIELFWYCLCREMDEANEALAA